MIKKIQKTKKAKKDRVWELDAARGLAILLVVWDHFMYDAGYVFRSFWLDSNNIGLIQFSNFCREYWTSDWRFYGWPVFVALFFYISGMCTTFSRSNFIRALRMGIVAGLLSLVTYLIQFEFTSGEFNIFIKFGVIHCFALCLAIFSLVEFLLNLFSPENPLRKKVKAELESIYPEDVQKSAEYKGEYKQKLNVLKEDTSYKSRELVFRYIKLFVYIVITVVAFVLNDTYNVNFFDFQTRFATVVPTSEWTGMFVYTRDWWTADYFPLLPFFCFFMLGASSAVLFYPHKKSLLPKLDKPWHKVLTIPGRYSIWVYFISQILALGILGLIAYSI